MIFSDRPLSVDRRTVFITGRMIAVTCLFLLLLLHRSAGAADEVDFNRDIRPILSDHCFECHGPDEERREAGLRLDTREGLLSVLDENRSSGSAAPDQSELYRRITAADPGLKMPPEEAERSLKPEQIALIRRWIESGAEWEQHWSFITPVRPEIPDVSRLEWVSNPIDAFVLARLDQEGLEPSPSADRRTLIRRVSFDLTGLPPTPEEVNAFLNDDSPEAYQKVVDRLLKSPRYAERMAIRWLDAARYADTSGYQSDGPRYMWRWRDWVVEAFDNNMPFDQFTIEQLAGDLLPDPTLKQKIATGFNRNHRGNAEGGIVPEEFQVEYVVDRVDTTFTVWQGLTMGCARCHSHKFDPISQQEYYQVFACFNNIPESGRALKEGNSPPYILAPTREQRKEIDRKRKKLRTSTARYRRLAETTEREFTDWRNGGWKTQTGRQLSNWDITDGLVLKSDLDELPAGDSAGDSAGKSAGKRGSNSPAVSVDGESRAKNPAVKGDLKLVPGRIGKAVRTGGDGFVRIPDVAKFGYFDRFSLGAQVFMPEHEAGTVVSKMELVDRGSGYNLHITDDGKVQLNLVKRWLDDSLRVESLKSIPTGRWVHVFATYDGSRVSDSIRIYINGEHVGHKANLDGINQSFATNEPVRIGTGNSNFHGLVDDVRIYDRVLSAEETLAIAEPHSVRHLLERPARSDSRAARGRLVYYFKHHAARPEIVDAVTGFEAAQTALRDYLRTLPTVMVMEEMETPRQTHVLKRGQYDQPGQPVEFGVPSSLPPLPKDASENRLGLARWLVNRDNPLTARVTVNRFWRDFFGTGIVSTAEDFGVQGDRPSHPELLDWLAVEFMESGWDVKRLLRTIVMSSTYRQSSARKKNEEGTWTAGDPDNRLLSRGSRFRLPAEMVRDQALLVSGMLTEKVGGPSVRPYQPKGLLQAIASDTKYPQDHGPDLYRRSLYTYWKRTVAPPMMTNFDAAGRETCQVRQTRTNTPLQALNLLNEVTFIEAARVLAQNVCHVTNDDRSRLNRLYERVLCRPPRDREAGILLSGLEFHRRRFTEDTKAAEELLDTGEWPLAKDIPAAELAAWTVLGNTVLNLDETLTKE